MIRKRGALWGLGLAALVAGAMLAISLAPSGAPKAIDTNQPEPAPHVLAAVTPPVTPPAPSESQTKAVADVSKPLLDTPIQRAR